MNIFKSTIIFFAFCFFSIPIYSQTMFGVKGGFNLNILNRDIYSFAPGYHGGVYFLHQPKKLGLMTELLINTKGANAFGVKDSLILPNQEFRYVSDEKIRLTTFNIPLTLHHKVFEGFNIYTGPSFSYIFSSIYIEIEETEILDKNTGIKTIIVDDKRIDTRESTQLYEMGWIAGVQYKYSKFAFSARYNMGLTKLNTLGVFNYYSHSIQLSLMMNLWEK